jgi:hypothetical protein
MSTRKQTINSLPDYLNDLDKPQTYLNSGDYSYLQGLSVRPTKRKRFVPQESCSTDSDTFCQVHLQDEIINIPSGIFWTKSYVILPSVVLIICISVTLLFGKQSVTWASCQSNNTKSSRERRRRKVRKDTSILVDTDTGSVEVIHESLDGSIANPVLLTSSEESAEEEIISLECDDNLTDRLREYSEIKQTVNKSEINDQSKTGNEIVTHQSRDDIQLPDNNICTSPHLANGQITNSQIEQLAQKWESKGLDRQKSLELAAHFEMNMLFFREFQNYLCVLACNIMNRFDWMHLNNLKQMEQQRQDQMNAPYLKEMKRHRRHMTYMLLKTQVLTRCIIVALASRAYFMHRNTPLPNQSISLSFTNVLSTAFSHMCPECSTETSQMTRTLSSSYIFDSLSNFIYYGVESVSCTATCSLKIFWYVSLLLFCHQYISRSLSCGVVALLIVDWKSILELGIVVTVMNLILTLIVCKHMDAKGEIMGTREASKYYERWIVSCEVLVLLLSVLLGFFFSRCNSP